MDRNRLKYTLLAIADRIFSNYSTEDLEDALEHFSAGYGVKLYPDKPIDLDDYEAVLPKIKRAFKPRSFVRRIQKDMNPVPENLVKMVQINVPLKMDLSNLSAKERMVLLQNLDMPVLMTCHQPKRSKTEFSCMAKIGIQMTFLHTEQKCDPEIDNYIQLYNPQTGYFLSYSKKSCTKIIYSNLSKFLKNMGLIFIPIHGIIKPP